MRLFAFAALLALPLLGLAAQSASADYYCCGRNRGDEERKVGWTKVQRESAIFDCDAHHCRTRIKIYEDTKVKVSCRNGWCLLKKVPFANMWVLEECLKPFDKEESDGDEDKDGEEDRDRSEGYKRYHYRRY